MFYFFGILITYPVLRAMQAVRRRKRTGNSRRFLVYQTAKIGDLVCTTHVFRAVKRKYPDAHLAVIVSEYAEPILRNNTRVDDIIVLNNELKGLYKKLLFTRKLLRGSYDAAVVLIPNPAFVFMSVVALIPRVVTVVPDNIGVTQRAVSLFCKRVKHRMGSLTMETYLRALELIGIDNGDLKKEVFFTRNDEEKALQFMIKSGAVPNNDKCVGLVVSAANKMKALDFKVLLDITDALVRKFNAKVALLGTAPDINVCSKIIHTLRYPTIIDACGRFGLSELSALISLLDLVVGVDTAPIYVADALDIPVVVIAGPCDMGDQRPIGKNVRIIKSNCSCAPCSHTYATPYKCSRGDRVCLTGLNSEEILSSCSKLLKRLTVEKRSARPKNVNMRGDAISE